MKNLICIFLFFSCLFPAMLHAGETDNHWERRSYNGYQALYRWDVGHKHQMAIIKTSENTVNIAVFVGSNDFYEYTRPEYRWEKTFIKPIESYMSIQDKGFSMIDNDGAKTRYWLERIKHDNYVMFKFRTAHKQEEFAMFELEGAEAAIQQLLDQKTVKTAEYRYGKRVKTQTH
ncbi:Uncharacterised protein [BD1-7 clade bacterium]|uniref:DUF3108 domain-containing protein n=1 Tax=BD1-7 clade bacterium TaxID=2029982 RepID=A0A5S9QB97_9GAMM|nr:Uncharacterised protein [BD1-7 clade bacterium]